MRHAIVILVSLVGCASDETRAPCKATSSGDVGDVPALKSQLCNVPMSMGMAHWFRLSAELPEQIVQLELWDNRGPFAGDIVHGGTFTIAGDDADPTTCGVCLRSIVDKGLETEREYFATGGTIGVTSISMDMDAPFVAEVIDAAFVEITDDKSFYPDGCTADLARAKISGTIEVKGGTGGGGGGGGGGGNGCLFTVGD